MAQPFEKQLDIIFIAGAPGTGKSTIAKCLQSKFNTPCFEFGWIPEFQDRGDGNNIGYVEEESLSFENLTLVIKNYIKNGFKNVIVTDLEDKRISQIQKIYQNYNYIIVTLYTTDDDILKSRVLDASRTSGYREYKKAIDINNVIINRKLYRNEVRLNSTEDSPDMISESVIQIINKLEK